MASESGPSEDTYASKAHKAFVKMAATATDPSQSAPKRPYTSPYASKQHVAAPGGGCPVLANPIQQQQKPSSNSPTSGSGCPVVGLNPSNNMPSSPNAPLPGQSKPLSTWRQHSSIPTGSTAAEKITDKPIDAHNTWVYPSEQMFYNAMKRKGWSPDEDDMTAVVAIHNAVNERAWKEILHWEKVNGASELCGGPRLVRFRGRPQDYSPKARLLNFLGYKLPFDRHDWVVDRCGREVRYIIDFYNAAPQPHMPAALHLDVRPALDTPQALFERLRMQWRWVASGRWRRE